eukprot:1044878-Rhodomonas_salina.1
MAGTEIAYATARAPRCAWKRESTVSQLLARGEINPHSAVLPYNLYRELILKPLNSPCSLSAYAYQRRRALSCYLARNST